MQNHCTYESFCYILRGGLDAKKILFDATHLLLGNTILAKSTEKNVIHNF